MLNKEPTELLISPFGNLWRALQEHNDAWGTVTTSLEVTAKLKNCLAPSDQHGPTGDADAALREVYASALQAGESAKNLTESKRDILVYPSFVGSWALLEAAFEDMICSILENESDSSALIKRHNINANPALTVGNRAWALDAFKRIESKFRVAGSVVKTHIAIFQFFDMPMAYPESYSELIEEINQIRNCILHRGGEIDAKAVTIAPRLKQYLGQKIPASGFVE